MRVLQLLLVAASLSSLDVQAKSRLTSTVLILDDGGAKQASLGATALVELQRLPQRVTALENLFPIPVGPAGPKGDPGIQGVRCSFCPFYCKHGHTQP